MRLFGWTIAREKAEQKALQPIDHRGGWFDYQRTVRGRLATEYRHSRRERPHLYGRIFLHQPDCQRYFETSAASGPSG